MMRMLLAIGLILLPLTTKAQTISGPATASDGDSLAMTGARIRLFGIDAPEAAQTCKRDGRDWACGADAKAQLVELVADRTVECEQRAIDAYGRIVAVCRAGGLDLAAVMAGAGLAIALPDFTDAYLAGEARARQHRLGLWGSEFETPAAWRAAHRLAEARPLPREPGPAPSRTTARNAGSASGCVIKGNRNRRGQWIYHLPDMPYYDQTRAEELFCSEADAISAGYRRAIVRP